VAGAEAWRSPGALCRGFAKPRPRPPAVFADNDVPHTSHADELVKLAVAIFGRGQSFVRKITGRADHPLQAIPDLELLVFLRPVKSRILFEQMLGRGTRKGEKYPDKSHFTVFDCFDGTLLAYFKTATAITAEPPETPHRTIKQVIEDIWANRDREYNIRCLVKRMQRIDKEMDGSARELFQAHGVPDGDLGKYASRLPAALRQDFTGGMKLLRNPAFQDLLVNYPRRKKTFLRAEQYEDAVTSQHRVRDAAGKEYRPEDYLAAFGRFVRDNPAKVEAIGILLDRPRKWGTKALVELREKLKAAPERFSVETLQKAHAARYHKALVDVISMVKHAAREQEPLLTAAERVQRAIAQVCAGRTFTAEQQGWLDRIRDHLAENLTIDREDFDTMPVLENAGGWGKASRVFGAALEPLIEELNAAMAA
jgi:type I restriction enzyme R subunit